MFTLEKLQATTSKSLQEIVSKVLDSDDWDLGLLIEHAPMNIEHGLNSFTAKVIDCTIGDDVMLSFKVEGGDFERVVMIAYILSKRGDSDSLYSNDVNFKVKE